MEWAQDMIDFLKELWQSGESTASMGRMCSARFRCPVSKNAIVGKVHRLSETFAGFEKRPSPIKLAKPDTGPPSPPVGAHTLPPLPSQRPPKPTRTTCPEPMPARAPDARASQYMTNKPAPLPVQALPSRPAPAPAPSFSGVRCEARDPTKPLLRRDGTGCLYPIGDPGSASFRYCDSGLMCLTKPYCEEHMKRTTIPIRRRAPDATSTGSYNGD